jgi:hypothetical protein
MGAVRRLLTFADLDDRDRRGHSISARLVAELADRTHVVLLDDRGWTSGHGGAAGHTPEEVEMTARMVVGPDEPRRDQTRVQVESDHWATMERKLKDAGVDTDGTDLRALPHDVEISHRLRRLLNPPRPT